MTHDKMVESLITYLVANNHKNIKCDLKGYTQPVEIYWQKAGDGHIPDATSTLDKTNYIFEVETADTISIEHTLSQLKLFSANAMQHGKIFVVAVPKTSDNDIKNVLAENILTAQIWHIG